MTELLRPYVPRPVVDWLRETPDDTHREVRGSFVFADISGFTALTEQLAARGKVGAEEMADVLNATFARLLVPAYDYGAALVKWGGDATLLLFTGDQHASRAARAAYEMQRVMRRVGRVRTTRGSVQLRMSVGVHSGVLDFFLVGGSHRELVVTGPAVAAVTALEQAAAAGEVLLSGTTRAALPDGLTEDAGGGAYRLISPPPASLEPQRTGADDDGVDVSVAVPPVVREHIAAGVVESEHRVVTTGFVQFGDIDEMLARQGPAAVADALHALLEAAAASAARHGITLLGTDIAADGGKLILVAGAPANNDRADERMLCALRDIVDAPGVLPVKAGCARGRVFCGDFGPRYRRTYSVVGDAVNLAARLMGAAEPGQVVTTYDVLRNSRTTFVAEPLAPLSLKGKSEPVTAVLVGPVAPAETQTLAVTSWPFVGRTAEIEELSSAWRTASAGRGACVTVTGAPGIGKTRLVAQFCQDVVGGDAVLSTSCDGYALAAPYRPWRHLLTKLIRREAGTAAGATDVATALRRLVRSRAPDLEARLPLFGAVLDVELGSTPEFEALDERFGAARLDDAVVELLTAVLQRGTMLWFDDAHLLDDASAQLLRSVARAAGSRPWLVVACARPGEAARRLPDDVPLALGPLDDDATAALLDAVTDDQPLPPHVARAIGERAAGNPLFLAELLDGYRRLGDLDGLPATLEGVLTAAIDAVPPESRRVLRLAAVLGTSFRIALLEDLARELSIPLTARTWRDIAPLVGRDGEHARFRSSLARDAAYEALPYRQRVRMHAAAGEHLERQYGERSHDDIAAMATHFYEARQFDRAVDYARRAGDLARERFALADAATFYRRALDAARAAPPAPAALRCELAETLGAAWYALGDLTRADAALAVARRYAGDDLAWARIALRRARVQRRAGNVASAVRHLGRGLTLLTGDTSVEGQATIGRLAACYAQVRCGQGRHREALAWAHRAVDAASRSGERDVLADAYQYLDIASIGLGDYRHEHQARMALQIWTDLGEHVRAAGLLNHLGIRAYYQGDWSEALGHYGAAKQLLDKVGDTWNAAIAAVNIVEILVDQGRVAEAERLAHASLRVFRSAETPEWTGWTTSLLGRAAAKQSRYDDAQRLFTAARSDEVRAGDAMAVADIDARLLECLVHEGRPHDALVQCERHIGGVSGPDRRGVLPLLERVRGLAVLHCGDREGAREAYLLSLAEAREMQQRPDIAAALDALIRLDVEAGNLPDDELLHERNELFAALGIRSATVALPDVTSGVPVQPRATAPI
ncbi:MAG: hypothetical protein QOD07_711 [Frankiaceae bacterium]|jgi:class 3 adenylate cyclase/tetratricopeptide (TPR) repeat protein|nr:hypothetical protein [Frankiaceae bacterium]